MTKDRAPVLARVVEAKVVLTPIGMILESTMLELPIHHPYARVIEHITMPDHAHTLIEIEKHVIDQNPSYHRFQHVPAGSVMTMVGGVKAATTREARIKRLWSSSDALWQPSFYESIVSSDDIEKVRKYIRNNPQRLIDKMRRQERQ
ncbi:MAG: transposase [Candidatus Kapabacteria bacterium]|nr:transposase [Candidatus Kapabacteria bacterium]